VENIVNTSAETLCSNAINLNSKLILVEGIPGAGKTWKYECGYGYEHRKRC
jgi:hypothetical protein